MYLIACIKAWVAEGTAVPLWSYLHLTKEELAYFVTQDSLTPSAHYKIAGYRLADI